MGGHRHHLHPKHMTGCQAEVKAGQVHAGQHGSKYTAGREVSSHMQGQVAAYIYTRGQFAFLLSQKRGMIKSNGKL